MTRKGNFSMSVLKMYLDTLSSMRNAIEGNSYAVYMNLTGRGNVGLYNNLILNQLLNPYHLMSYRASGELVSAGEVYKSFLSSEILADLNTQMIKRLSQELSPDINLSLNVIETTSNQLALLQDLIEISQLYLRQADGNLLVIRVRPRISKIASSIPDHAASFEALKTTALEATKGGLSGLADALDQSTKKIYELTANSKGEAAISFRSSVDKVVNALKAEVSGDGVISKIEGKDRQGKNTVLSMYPNAGRGMINLPPTLSQSFTIEFATQPNTKMLISELELFKCTYYNKGEIPEQEIVTPKPISTISVLEEKFELADILKPYFEIKHEVLLDESSEWILLRARNNDGSPSGLPEILLIGRDETEEKILPGVQHVPTTRPVNKFKYKASFEQVKAIPPKIYGGLLPREASGGFNTNSRLFQMFTVEDLFFANSAQQEMKLSPVPISKPIAYYTGQGEVTDTGVLGFFVGFHKAGELLQLPAYYIDYRYFSRIQIHLGEKLLTKVSGNPSTGEVRIDTNGVVTIGDSFAGAPVFASFQSKALFIVKRDELRGEAKASIFPPADPTNFSLYCNLDLEPVNATIPFQSFHKAGDVQIGVSFEPSIKGSNSPLGGGNFPLGGGSSSGASNQQSQKNSEAEHKRMMERSDIKSFTVESVVGLELIEKTSSGILYDRTAVAFVSQKTFVNGLEVAAVGDYSIDEKQGVLYLHADVLSANSTYTLNANLLVRRRETAEYIWYDQSSIIIRDARIYERSVILPAGQKQVELPLDAGSAVVLDSIVVPGYTQVDEQQVRRTSPISILSSANSGGWTLIKSPLWPLVDSLPVSLTANGVLLTGIVTDEQTIAVYDPMGEYGSQLLEVEFSYYESSNPIQSNTFYYQPHYNKLIISSASTEDLVISYQVHGYTAEYGIIRPMDEHDYSFRSPETIVFHKNPYTKHLTSRRTLQDVRALIWYTTAGDIDPKEVAELSKENLVTLIPHYVDIEVKLHG
jgi:hypothetical protein